ncbi:MAG: hypothetical protein AAFZ65_16230 [Planctomycetota bacterium]
MPSSIRSLSQLAGAALLCVLAACSTTRPEPDPAWRSADLTAPSRVILWDMTLAALDRGGYPPGAKIDPDAMEAESGWLTELQPFSGEGIRRKAVVRLRPLGSGEWGVDVRVKQQRNMSLVRPTDPEYAEWEWTGDDTESAGLLLAWIRGAVDPRFEASTGAGDEPEED